MSLVSVLVWTGLLSTALCFWKPPFLNNLLWDLHWSHLPGSTSCAEMQPGFTGTAAQSSVAVSGQKVRLISAYIWALQTSEKECVEHGHRKATEPAQHFTSQRHTDYNYSQTTQCERATQKTKVLDKAETELALIDSASLELLCSQPSKTVLHRKTRTADFWHGSWDINSMRDLFP